MSEPTKTTVVPKGVHLVPEALREKWWKRWHEKHPVEDAPPEDDDDDDEPAKLFCDEPE